MTAIHTVDAKGVTADQLAALEAFTSRLGQSELRDLLLSLTTSVKNGSGVAMFEDEAEVTPVQAAAQLKMSRTHLYKLLDDGVIVSHHVGRDRRIRVTDLVQFEAGRQRDRRELAERFAHSQQTRVGAIEELMGDL